MENVGNQKSRRAVYEVSMKNAPQAFLRRTKKEYPDVFKTLQEEIKRYGVNRVSVLLDSVHRPFSVVTKY